MTDSPAPDFNIDNVRPAVEARADGRPDPTLNAFEKELVDYYLTPQSERDDFEFTVSADEVDHVRMWAASLDRQFYSWSPSEW